MGLFDILKGVFGRLFGGGGTSTKDFLSSKVMKCPNCGATINLGMERCPKCGVRIKSMFKKKCPRCGALNDLDTKKCYKCGYDFEAEYKRASKTYYVCPVCGYRADYYMTECPVCHTKFI